MKEFFKKLGKKLKKIFGWVLFLLIMLIWAIYDFFYNSKTHWKIFGMRLPQYIRFGAILFALFMIFGRKSASKKGGKNAADTAEKTDGTGTSGAANAETKDETAACDADKTPGAETEEKTDETRENGEDKKKDDENRQ